MTAPSVDRRPAALSGQPTTRRRSLAVVAGPWGAAYSETRPQQSPSPSSPPLPLRAFGHHMGPDHCCLQSCHRRRQKFFLVKCRVFFFSFFFFHLMCVSPKCAEFTVEFKRDGKTVVGTCFWDVMRGPCAGHFVSRGQVLCQAPLLCAVIRRSAPAQTRGASLESACDPIRTAEPWALRSGTPRLARWGRGGSRDRPRRAVRVPPHSPGRCETRTSPRTPPFAGAQGRPPNAVCRGRVCVPRAPPAHRLSDVYDVVPPGATLKYDKSVAAACLEEEWQEVCPAPGLSGGDGVGRWRATGGGGGGG